LKTRGQLTIFGPYRGVFGQWSRVLTGRGIVDLGEEATRVRTYLGASVRSDGTITLHA
jgi:hypothetical protein